MDAVRPTCFFCVVTIFLISGWSVARRKILFLLDGTRYAISVIDAVRVLKNKVHYRAFLPGNEFSYPELCIYRSARKAMDEDGSVAYLAIAKSADAAGSRRCLCADGPEGLKTAVEYVLEIPRGECCTAEQLLEKEGEFSDADGFATSSRFTCASFIRPLFNPTVPNTYALAPYMVLACMPVWVQVGRAPDFERSRMVEKRLRAFFNGYMRVKVC